jgi:diguanylate cyclase (GGDEF)-like protein/PAS domain S-box-containing protein
MKLTQSIKDSWMATFPLPMFIVDKSMKIEYSNAKANIPPSKLSKELYIENILGTNILPYLGQFQHSVYENRFAVFDINLETYGESKIFGNTLDEIESKILLIIVPQYYKTQYLDLKNEFSLLLEHINVSIITTDVDMKITDVNPAFNKMFGFSNQKAIGKKPTILKSGKQSNEFYKNMYEELKENGVFHGELVDKKYTGELHHIRSTIFEVKEKNGIIRKYYGILEDITEIKTLSKKVETTSNKDTLTGAENRESFFSIGSLKSELASEKHSMALFFIDLDKFKAVNDVYGHTAGDFVLAKAAARIKDSIRASDILGRFGGDEFLVLLENIDIDKATYVAKKIIDSLELPYKFGKETINFISASIGIAIAPFDGNTLEELIEKSDSAMYLAKKNESANKIVIAKDMLHDNKNIKNMKTEFFKAMQNDEIYIRMQPIVKMGTKEIAGCEVLARWLNLYFNEVSPATFIPIATTHNLLETFDTHILNLTIKELEKTSIKANSFVHVNISGKLFSNVDFIEKTKELINKFEFLKNLLIIEITEQTLMENIQLAAQHLDELKELGVRIAIDDFGTGFSSLSYLKHFSIDYLKIDISFVKDIEKNEKNRSIVKTIIFLADAIGAQTIAEGIETAEQYKILNELGADYGQGYYFDYPLLPMSYFEKIH